MVSFSKTASDSVWGKPPLTGDSALITTDQKGETEPSPPSPESSLSRRQQIKEDRDCLQEKEGESGTTFALSKPPKITSGRLHLAVTDLFNLV